MSDRRNDLLDVVSDQQERSESSLLSKIVDKRQKMLSCHRIETRAGFIENQHVHLGSHQGPADQDPLAFALRHRRPDLIAKFQAIHSLKHLFGGANFLFIVVAPVIDHRMTPGEDDIESGFFQADQLRNAAADKPNSLAPIVPLLVLGIDRVLPSLHFHFALRWCEVSHQHIQDRCFSRSIASENDPMLPFLNAPTDVVEDFLPISANGHVLHFKYR